jgi:hypothetical protein
MTLVSYRDIGTVAMDALGIQYSIIVLAHGSDSWLAHVIVIRSSSSLGITDGASSAGRLD